MNHPIPLALLASGKTATVVDIRAGQGLIRRLAGMGLTVGVSLRVVNNPMRGPIVAEVRGAKLALGYGIAQKIMVKEE